MLIAFIDIYTNIRYFCVEKFSRTKPRDVLHGRLAKRGRQQTTECQDNEVCFEQLQGFLANSTADCSRWECILSHYRL